MVWPNPDEVAILKIDDFEYSDWETVQVRHCKFEPPYFTVRFTCSEGMPLAKNLEAMRILPGQFCTVTLGGKLAISGYVYSRQVFVDGRRHHVEIQAGSNAITSVYSSIIHKSGEFKDVTAEKFLKTIFNGIGLNFSVSGSLPQTKFPRISIAPGTSVFEGAEMVLRQIGNYPMTSSPEGGVIVVADHRKGEDTIYEGQLGRPSYTEAQETIFNTGMANGRYGLVQGESKDTSWGAQNKSIPFLQDQFDFPLIGGNTPLTTVLEIPSIDANQFLAGRMTAEREFQGTDLITVIPTVQGWMRPSGGLWNVEQKVRVVSPMLVMDGSLALIPKVITFMQDNAGGTRTRLELCNDRALSKVELE